MPQKAIQVTLTDQDYVNSVIRRISGLADISSNGAGPEK